MTGKRPRVFSLSVIVLVAALGSGCRFSQLKNDLTELDSLTRLRGEVTTVSTEEAPIVVVLLQDEGDVRTLADYRILRHPGEFEMGAFPGSYFIGAFQDSNQDLRLDDDELAAFYDDARKLEIVAGANLVDLDLHLEAPLVGEVEDYIGAFREELPLFKRDLGDVTSLNDERFAPEQAANGLWNPVDFLFDVGGGIYFIEEFDPTRIPVLFVHGASGTPRDFEQVIASLDRERFQAWVFFYPSGLRLGRVGPFLHELVEELQAGLEFDRLFVVAHSMGGLVSRSYLNTYTADPERPDYVKRFVTFSTPWAGQKMAGSGVKYAPRVVPSWRDMDPSSDFLAELLVVPLPPGVEHALLFGYKGDRGDGTIKLNSQLAQPAQAGAVRVLGFEETHMSILSSEQALAAFHEFLAAP